jgi:hypothetical protein
MFKLILWVFLEEMINIWNVNNDGWHLDNEHNKSLKIPKGGLFVHFSWLCQEATVQDIQTDSNENLVVDVIITRTAFEKFKSQFQNQRTKVDHEKGQTTIYKTYTKWMQ